MRCMCLVCHSCVRVCVCAEGVTWFQETATGGWGACSFFFPSANITISTHLFILRAFPTNLLCCEHWNFLWFCNFPCRLLLFIMWPWPWRNYFWTTTWSPHSTQHIWLGWLHWRFWGSPATSCLIYLHYKVTLFPYFPVIAVGFYGPEDHFLTSKVTLHFKNETYSLQFFEISSP